MLCDMRPEKADHFNYMKAEFVSHAGLGSLKNFTTLSN